MERRRKKSKAPVAIIIIVVILVIGWLGFNKFYNDAVGAAEPGNTVPITVEIPSGSTAADVDAVLVQNGLAKDVPLRSYFYKMHCKRMGYGYDRQFIAGIYELNKNMNLDAIAEVLIAGDFSKQENQAAAKRFTIPEGYNILQIARTLEEAGICWTDDFYYEAESGVFDYAFLADCPPGRERLEGFLYPETYEVATDATAHDVVEIMLRQFDKLFLPEYYDRAAARGMSVRDVVTMGSIIERESVKAEERPLMAGVFYNRLDQGMKLESCATIQYILGEPKQFLTNADTQIQSPYNTYLHEGLPPGPICNPRMASIEAALYPDDNDFIFFVLSPDLDGSHRFSADYNEFLRNKDAYYAAEEAR